MQQGVHRAPAARAAPPSSSLSWSTSAPKPGRVRRPRNRVNSSLVAKAARGAGALEVLGRVGRLWAYDYLGIAPGKTKGAYNKRGLSPEGAGRPQSNAGIVAGALGTAAFNLGVAPILSDGLLDFALGFVPGVATLDAIGDW